MQTHMMKMALPLAVAMLATPMALAADSTSKTGASSRGQSYSFGRGVTEKSVASEEQHEAHSNDDNRIDLYIRDMRLAGRHGLRVGDCGRVELVVGNANKKHAAPRDVGLIFTGPDGARQTRNLGKIKPGAFQKLSFDINVPKAGNYRMKAAIYLGWQAVIDMSENDNVMYLRASAKEECATCNVAYSYNLKGTRGSTEVASSKPVPLNITVHNRDGAKCPARTLTVKRTAKDGTKVIGSKRLGMNDGGNQYFSLSDDDHPYQGSATYRLYVDVANQRQTRHTMGTVKFVSYADGKTVERKPADTAPKQTYQGAPQQMQMQQVKPTKKRDERQTTKPGTTTTKEPRR